MDAVVVTSGGLDSTTALYKTLFDENEVMAISFNYGQKHKIELKAAKAISERLGIEHQIVELPQWSKHTALTDPDHDVPEGHYADATMKQTVVPNRNAIMLNVAAGIAIDAGARYVVTGVHAGDHPVYPDCRPEFIDALNEMLETANDEAPHVIAPFIDKEKDYIAWLAFKLGVPIQMTWSCYKGGVYRSLDGPVVIQCGRCSTCVERQEAIHKAGFTDPTEYADNTYWKEVVNG
jgi:7-cyano-7-deazaguanine synthase